MIPEQKIADAFTDDHIAHLEELVTALESGEYKQGRLRLRLQRDGEPVEHCCLGVACEISKLGSWGQGWEPTYHIGPIRSTNIYPSQPIDEYYVPNKAESLNLLPSTLGILTTVEPTHRPKFQTGELAVINDHSTSFAPTAAVLKKCIAKIRELKENHGATTTNAS